MRLNTADDEIMRLIRDTNDPQSKAMLMVLLRISSNLSDNTRLTRTLSTTFEEHQRHVAVYMEKGNQLINRGIGAWKAIAALSVVVYAFGAYMVTGYIGDLTAAKRRIDLLDIEVATQRTRLTEHLQQVNPLVREYQKDKEIEPMK